MTDYDGPWVSVVFLDGEEFNEIEDMGIQEMTDYLSQGDYGPETDDAHTTDTAQWGRSGDHVYKVGQYVLTTNYHLGYASLNRRPMGTVVTR